MIPMDGSSLGSLLQPNCLCSCCICSCLKTFILVSFIWNTLSLNILKIYSLIYFWLLLNICFLNEAFPMLFTFLSSSFSQSNFQRFGETILSIWLLLTCFLFVLFCYNVIGIHISIKSSCLKFVVVPESEDCCLL